MRDQHKKPATTDRVAPVAQVVKQPKVDPKSAALQAAAAKNGNQAHADKAADANKHRDGMLHFIGERLAQAQILQHQELDQVVRNRVWYDEVARGKTGFTLPDPTRWRQCARLYGQATQALCQGELGRGATLMDQAVEAERTAWHSLPAQVKPDERHKPPEAVAAARMGVGSGAMCGHTTAQGLLDTVREMEFLTERAEEVPNPQRNRAHGWWGAEVEDEAPKKAAPAAPVAAEAAHAPKAAAPPRRAGGEGGSCQGSTREGASRKGNASQGHDGRQGPGGRGPTTCGGREGPSRPRRPGDHGAREEEGCGERKDVIGVLPSNRRAPPGGGGSALLRGRRRRRWRQRIQPTGEHRAHRHAAARVMRMYGSGDAVSGRRSARHAAHDRRGHTTRYAVQSSS